MAWTNIDNSLVSVGALPFATTIQALRDNPIAIANGDAGAPQIQRAAIAAGAVDATKLATGAGEINWVGARTAGLAAAAVGSYAFCRPSTGGPYSAGAVIAGSSLGYAGVNPEVKDGEGVTRVEISVQVSGSPGGGTWRCMGYSQTITNSGVTGRGATLWLRIA